MQKKNVLIVILTVFVFLSATFLGVYSVYRVNFVTVNAPVVSTEAKDEAAQLQARLFEAYEGENIFRFDVYFNASKANIEKSSILKKLKSQCRDRTKF